MYLKSLTLKGFKSFADRTVLKFEPGVAAVVGPNGSGKSNISDAVLWVLGERNAKNLRGQSMEDVIFSGSSARKPVGLAEVELLLDNSDGVLPVDFDEVSVGRRMYRNGESEYLINGSVVRRMDVLDILHDSGLGTGTHSIISQGNLDSVLSSKPEDRRALIEEAAGILKHKERKAKSERKLARMDNNLARIIDVTSEVERQLKPLERKAKKALTFQRLDEERAELKLKVSVDNLRLLQKQWEETETKEKTQVEQLSLHQEQLSASEQELNSLQIQLKDRGAKENALNVSLRKVQNAHERINSSKMLLREKRKQAEQELERVARLFEESKINEKRALEELASAEEQYVKAKEAHEKAQESLATKEAFYDSLVSQRNGLRKQIDTLTAEQRGFTHRKETIQAAQLALSENLSASRAKAQVLETQLRDAKARMEASQKEADGLKTESERLQKEYEEAKVQSNQAREQMNASLLHRENVRKTLDDVRNNLTKVSAERAAIEELERASAELNPVRSWLNNEQNGFKDLFVPLTHVMSAPSELEVLTESLLGDSLQTLLFDTDSTIVKAVASLQSNECVGTAQLASKALTPVVKHLKDARWLFGELTIKNEYQDVIGALIGDVYIVDTLEQALDLHKQRSEAVRFVSLDGCVVYPQGHIALLDISPEHHKEGVLSRRRTYEQLSQKEQELTHSFNECQKQLTEAEEELRKNQSESLKLSERVAQLKGDSESAKNNAQRALSACHSAQVEYENIRKEQKENQDFLSKAQPDSDDLEESLVTVLVQLEQNNAQVSELKKTLSPLQREIISVSEELSDLRLSSARLSERSAYAERMVATRKQEISSSARTNIESQQRKIIAQGVVGRVDSLLEKLGSLTENLSLLGTKLEIESMDAQNYSQGLHEKITQATKQVHDIHDMVDAVSAKLGEIRIEKGRLEVQVEAAIKVIVEDCSTSIETASKLEVLENREEAVAQLESLERRIKNLGTINPDAAVEYEEVKERFDFFEEQLQDMKSARQALSRIVAVIDERMKDDFIQTFNQVNDNFADIFSTLFPGGKAHLSLVDPDDLENTGVDVNAQPVGKRVRKMSLLSGGEKSMTAMALLFAVYKIRQTPFYILDEVEAALDDSNLRRLMAYLEAIRHNTQFIMITHQRRTMESADILYGVSMQADGVTKVFSQKLEQATSKEA